MAIGVFDGVHRAHKAIIKKTVNIAKQLNGTSIILTFNPHPAKILGASANPLLLTSLDHRLRLIAQLEPDICLVLKFNKIFAKMRAEDFTRNILKKKLGAAWIIVGEKFNFGKNKNGDIDQLIKQGQKLGYKVSVTSSQIAKGKIISSSLIRALVRQGKLKEASLMLGRAFSILGTVEKGDRRGKKLGFPTANIDPHQEVLPPGGVYSVRVKAGKTWHGGVLNIGIRPTFSRQKKRPVVEVHIFNFRRNIYRHNIEVEFFKKIRNEKRFRSPDLLKKQVILDKIMAKRQLAKKGRGVY